MVLWRLDQGGLASKIGEGEKGSQENRSGCRGFDARSLTSASLAEQKKSSRRPQLSMSSASVNCPMHGHSGQVCGRQGSRWGSLSLHKKWPCGRATFANHCSGKTLAWEKMSTTYWGEQ